MSGKPPFSDIDLRETDSLPESSSNSSLAGTLAGTSAGPNLDSKTSSISSLENRSTNCGLTVELSDLLYRPVVFQRPERLVRPRSWEGHIPFAMWVMEASNPRNFVELGTYSGNSYCAFCQAVKSLQYPTRCYAVDTWKGDPQAGFYGDEILVALEEHHNPRYGTFSRLIRRPFNEALTAFSDHSIDLLHLDGYHTYDAVLSDFTAWLPKMSERGVMLFHDINVRERDFGAWKVWEEIVSPQFPSFSFLHSNGLGVAAVGKEIPERVKLLLDLSKNAANASKIREFFSFLGNNLTEVLSQEQKEVLTIRSRLSAVELELQRERLAAREVQQGLQMIAHESESLRNELSEFQGDRQKFWSRLEETRTALSEARSLAQSAETDRRVFAAYSLVSNRRSQRLNEEHELYIRRLRDTARDATRRNALSLPQVANFLSVSRGREILELANTTPEERLARLVPNENLTKLAAKQSYRVVTGKNRLASMERSHIERIASSGLFEASFYQLQFAAKTEVFHPVLHYIRHGVKEGKDPHPLFSTSYYLSQNPDVAERNINPLLHFIEQGAREGRNPHPVFDVSYYQRQLHSLTGENPLLHYIRTGEAKGINPHPLFDPRYYRETQLSDPTFPGNALTHFLLVGGQQQLSPHPLFSTEYYCRNCPRLTGSGTNPLVDYIIRGAEEDLSPHPLFSPDYYRTVNPTANSHPSPLIHYLGLESQRLAAPHPLFDPEYYISQLSPPDRSKVHPLLHFLRTGWQTDLKPHPLFDTAYYRHLRRVAQMPDDLEPMAEFLEFGTMFLRDPHPLFDMRFYISMNSAAIPADQNPLVHFITKGALESRDPHPLFDTAFYKSNSLDLASHRINCLVHYLDYGAFEGRNPNKHFDSAYYRTVYPDITRTGMNPLVHYTMLGWKEGRKPNGDFKVEVMCPEAIRHDLNPVEVLRTASIVTSRKDAANAPLQIESARPEHLSVSRIVALSENPTEHLRVVSRSPASRGNTEEQVAINRRTVIYVSHVSPYPARAGNEYRIQRIHNYLKKQGYRVILIISPLAGEELSKEQIATIEAEAPEFLLCARTGEVSGRLFGQSLCDSILQLNGQTVEEISNSLGEHLSLPTRDRHLVRIEREFCPDHLVQTVRALREEVGPAVVISNYVFMTRIFPLLPPQTLRVLDTHDVFSTKIDKVVAHGVADELNLTSEEESARLRRSDIVIAIQPEEEAVLRRMLDDQELIVAGVDFDIPAGDYSETVEDTILYIGSNNAMNRKGLRDFLKFGWPRIKKARPAAKLLVAGKVAEDISEPLPGVEKLGVVDDLEALYSRAKVVINPAVAGTGLKVKNVEALCRYRAVVTWPSGVDGLPSALKRFFAIAEDWYDFSSKVIDVLGEHCSLSNSLAISFSPSDREEIQRLLSSDLVYQKLNSRLERFFGDLYQSELKVVINNTTH